MGKHVHNPRVPELIAARAAGATRYFTGKPCPRGHVAERMVSTRACVGCIKDRSRSPKGKLQKSRANKNWNRVHPLYWDSRRCRRMHTPPWAKKLVDQFIAIQEEARRRRAAGESVEIHHIVPLRGRRFGENRQSVCGLNLPWNLQIVPKEINRQKNCYYEGDEHGEAPRQIST